jgi:hypothetical protein
MLARERLLYQPKKVQQKNRSIPSGRITPFALKDQDLGVWIDDLMARFGIGTGLK